ncbi:MAG: hypothetical protein ACJAV5_000782 [Vicingaceae bacterium]|jgi:hypothetical protein
MKTKNLMLISFLIIFSTVACETSTKDKKETKVEQPAHEEESSLQLNDGERWEANAETTQGVNNMIQLVQSFTAEEDIVAYQTLSDNLESAFTTIFQKCTMKGDAHNQLHNFLFPMKSLFKKLSSVELDESKVAFDELDLHLAQYQNFFK